MKLATIAGSALLILALSGEVRAGVLLIPDSGADKVWAFDPFDGTVINANFIPNTSALSQPINAVDNGNGSILVTDETGDTVLQFTYTGAYVGVFANSSTGIDGPFGLTVHNGKVYVASNVNGRIVRYDANGANPTIWASGFGTPRDITFRSGDALVSESGGDDIVRFDLNGVFQNIWHNSDGVSGIDFPQQLQLEGNGNVLAAGFTPPFGLYLYDSNGSQVTAYTNLITSPRGVYRLGNGQILYAGGTRVMRYDPNTATETAIVNNASASFRFIEYADLTGPIPVRNSSWSSIKALYGN